MSGSELITRLPLYDKLIRAARHVQQAAPPSWLVRYLPVGGQQPGNRKNPSPVRASQPGLCAAEALWEGGSQAPWASRRHTRWVFPREPWALVSVQLVR